MSFKGANPEIEKLMKTMEHSKTPASKTEQVLLDEKDADVGAEEVAQSYSLNKTIGRKFDRFNQRVSNSNRGRGFKRRHN